MASGFLGYEHSQSHNSGTMRPIVKEHMFPVARHTNQLQFNLEETHQAPNLQTTFKKPKPLMIEKLPKHEADNVYQSFSSDIKSSTSSLTNHRLDLAMKLAKRDVKKLRSMLEDPHNDLSKYVHNQEEQKELTGPVKDQAAVGVKRLNQKQQKVSLNYQSTKAKKPIVGKLVSGSTAAISSSADRVQLRFFDSEGDEIDKNTEGHNEIERGVSKSGQLRDKDSTEIRRLQRELQKYMKRLDALLEQKYREKGSLSKIGKSGIQDQEVEIERKRGRATEQAARSARVLYMLQRKVQEIQDELLSKEDQMKHTKKSHSKARLAAAHRSAVRALQMFVNQAPLYYDVHDGLPSMYKELGLLIQQLSLLSSRLEDGKDTPAFDWDVLPRTKKLISSWDPQDHNHTVDGQSQPKQKAKPGTDRVFDQRRKDAFLDGHKDWIMEKARSAGIQKHVADEPTPERQAILQASKDALERAKESASFIKMDIEKEAGDVQATSKGRKKGFKEKKKSVLLPHRIKKQRQRKNVASISNTAHQSALGYDGMRFAKQTVSSVLKSHPEINYQPKKTKPYSQARSQVPEEVFVSYQSPKQRDADILRSASSSPSKNRQQSGLKQKSVSQSPDLDGDDYREGFKGVSEREAARQVWLDVEEAREMQRLQSLRKKEEERIGKIRAGYMNTTAIVADAEQKIRDKLQPLLEKAELLSLQEKSKEEEYKISVKRKLADLVADTLARYNDSLKAMSRGELLADLILDDLLIDTVEELHRLENDDIAQADAALKLMKPTVQEITQRISVFEEEEERIRRRWKKLHYSELDVNQAERSNELSSEKKLESNSCEARPIIFTASAREGVVADTREPPCREEKQPRPSKPMPKGTDFIPMEMRASILAYCRRHDNYLKRTVSDELDKFDPWTIVEKISDEIVDELVLEVEKELNKFCDDYVDGIYADEFIKNDSAVSESLSEI